MARVPVVDQDECTSCRLCCDIAPETFGMDDSDLAYILNASGDDEDTIQEAIDSCPVTCIAWQE